MLYSSGTTGRPKGVLRQLPPQPPVQGLRLYDFFTWLWRFREGMTYLSPAPLYHAAPWVAVNGTIRVGGTVVVMEHFDPERSFLGSSRPIASRTANWCRRCSRAC